MFDPAAILVQRNAASTVISLSMIFHVLNQQPYTCIFICLKAFTSWTARNSSYLICSKHTSLTAFSILIQLNLCLQAAENLFLCFGKILWATHLSVSVKPGYNTKQKWTVSILHSP